MHLTNKDIQKRATKDLKFAIMFVAIVVMGFSLLALYVMEDNKKQNFIDQTLTKEYLNVFNNEKFAYITITNVGIDYEYYLCYKKIDIQQKCFLTDLTTDSAFTISNHGNELRLNWDEKLIERNAESVMRTVRGDLDKAILKIRRR